MTQMDEMMKDLGEKRGKEFDKAFLIAMISHHQQAIAMAKMAADKAEMMDLKTMAAAMKDKQGKEIEQMEAMLQK